MKGQLIQDHLGNEFKSIAQMCKHWNMNYTCVKTRLDKGWTVEDALTVPPREFKTKDHLGNEFNSISEMAKHWGIHVSTLQNRLKLGYTLENALTEPLHDYSYTDHLGNKFESVKEMCKYWGVKYQTVNGRLQKGWSVEDALLKPIPDNSYTDHLGNRFESLNKMCKHWGIKKDAFRSRIRKGMTIEEALTTPVQNQIYAIKCKDHLGNEFKSIKDMCKYWNVSYYTVITRLNDGWSVEEALTTPTQNITVKVIAKDHLGNEFKTITDMTRYWGINAGTFTGRIKKGWSVEDALTTPTQRPKKDKPSREKCKDHLGNEFKTKKAMCEYWNIDFRLFQRRMNDKWPLEKALTTPIDDTSCIDPLGNKFKSQGEMCRYYNIKFSTYISRLTKYGHSLAVALGISPIIQSNFITINQSKYNLIISKRIKMGKDVFECFIDNGDGTSTFRIMTYDMIDQYCLDQYKKLHNIVTGD